MSMDPLVGEHVHTDVDAEGSTIVLLNFLEAN